MTGLTPLEETLVSLIATPSVTGFEGRLCTDVAERMLATWGLDGVARIGNSLVVGKRTERPLITLFGHLDTVPEQEGNGTPRITDDRIHGLGATDMKAGLAVMIHLLENPRILSGRYDVVGVFYDKEEGPQDENGLEAVLEHVDWLHESELAVVLEPTDLEIQLGCNGAMNATVSFLGHAAHSARPWLGENAVTKAGAWLDELHRRRPEVTTVAGLEFREVFSVTMATGGVARNVLPSRFDVNLNYRFPPVFDLDEAEARLRATTAAADEVVIVDRAPGAPIPENNAALARLEEASGAVRASKQGWTDVARLAVWGIPAVNYGPGEVALAHQVDESLPRDHLTRAYAVMERFLTE
jgi:succinyl-diaminopimelate desuccinylase